MTDGERSPGLTRAVGTVGSALCVVKESSVSQSGQRQSQNRAEFISGVETSMNSGYSVGTAARLRDSIAKAVLTFSLSES